MPAVVLVPDSRAFSRIMVQNLVDSASTLTPSSENDDGTGNGLAENVKDQRPYLRWIPDAGTETLRATFGVAVDASVLCIHGHSLGTFGGTVKLQYSTNGGSTWNDATAAIAPVGTEPIYVTFDVQSAADWRLEVSSTPASSIGVWMLGTDVELPVGMPPGFSSPKLARASRRENNISETGQPLGTSLIAEGSRFDIIIRDAPVAWFDDQWEEIVDELDKGAPFFFLWDPETRPLEAAYCWVPNSRDLGQPTWASPALLNVNIGCRAQVKS